MCQAKNQNTCDEMKGSASWEKYGELALIEVGGCWLQATSVRVSIQMLSSAKIEPGLSLRLCLFS